MSNVRAARRAIPTAFLLVALAACGGANSTSSTAPAGTAGTAGTADAAGANGAPVAPAGTADATTVNGAIEVPQLLQFTAPLVGGGEFAGAAYAGRATAFWFWAPT